MSKLQNIQRGRLPSPLRYLFYGVEGVGKSTLAANAPEPIYFDLEDGTALIDCARYPFRHEPGGHVANDYAEVTSAIDDLLESEHDFQTLVIDTVDRLEPMLWRFICARDTKGRKKALHSIEDYGYGKGYQVALDEWRAFCHRLDQLRTRRGMGVVLLGHSQITKFQNPEGEDYDRYSLNVHKFASGFFREWCDVLGFCRFEEGGAKLDDGDGKAKAKGYSTGQRLMCLERTAAYDAKNRLCLPTIIEIAERHPWAPIGNAVLTTQQDENQLVTLIRGEIERIGDDELAAKVTHFMERGPDKQALISALHRLRRR